VTGVVWASAVRAPVTQTRWSLVHLLSVLSLDELRLQVRGRRHPIALSRAALVAVVLAGALCAGGEKVQDRPRGAQKVLGMSLPENVYAARLVGGPYDGIVIEVTAEQTTLDIEGGQPVMGGDLDVDLPSATYRYSGVVDAERHALFELAD